MQSNDARIDESARQSDFAQASVSRRTAIQAGSIGLLGFGMNHVAGEPALADEKAAAKIVVREDVVYGRVHGAGLLADIAFPESKEPLPVIISVHGGRWVGGHKKDACVGSGRRECGSGALQHGVWSLLSMVRGMQ